MNPPRWLSRALGVLVLACAPSAMAQTFPLELRGEAGLFNTNFGRGLNLGSQRGVPLSSTPGTPAASDGRAPTPQQQSIEGLPITAPTPGQFANLVLVGAVSAPRTSILVAGSNYVGSAVSLDLPRGVNSSGQVVAVLRAAQVGGAWFSRLPSLRFGGTIPPPETDEAGRLLSTLGVRAEEYWLPEPHSTNNHAGASYYWSRHAQQVFAIQTGPISVAWKRAQASVSVPQDYASDPSAYVVQSGFYYRIYPARYVVSGNPIKPPKQLYWTEGSYRSLGKPVVVPTARVGSVNILFNNNLPSRVDREVVEPGQIPVVETNRLEETRTVWYDRSQGQIFAYNREGRVFVELLGDARGDGETRQFLGFEIVDVLKQAQPTDVRVELGDLIHPGNDATDGGVLRPEPVMQAGGGAFLFRHVMVGSQGARYYAVRETQNLNDQLVYWMEPGEVGLYWPDRLVRYELAWPRDPGRYNHYLRPEAATEAESRLTAIPLPLSNAPAIEFQDALDVPRGKLTEKFEFYTHLDAARPVHRALLRFTSGDEVAFDRVFSWLAAAVAHPSIAGSSVATNLAGWPPSGSTPQWPSPDRAPRVVEAVATVGDRIPVPDGEAGAAGGGYLAGHVRPGEGDSFNPGAYIDPLARGFDAANRGAIIPVNAIPGRNRLEVWWFRPSQPDSTRGFGVVYWPSVIGRYALQWPTTGPGSEIVLASNHGSGDLPSLAARGRIYVQNDAAAPGYNPNEEHALMIGGRAWALRDDLNVTAGPGFSSEPCVLVDYTEADGRPAMRAFGVLREKPAAGLLFDYVAEAGRVLQAPLPLPLLPPPVEVQGTVVRNYNVEPPAQSGDLPEGWDSSRDLVGPHAHYRSFTFRDRKEVLWLYRGLHGDLPSLVAGAFVPQTGSVVPSNVVVAIVGQAFRHHLHATRRAEALVTEWVGTSPAWMHCSGLVLSGQPAAADVGTNLVALRVTSTEDGAIATNHILVKVQEAGAVDAQDELRIASTNAYSGASVTHVGRPPYLAAPPSPTNSFTMRFYYRTEEGFAWPGNPSPPPVGAIVPYLRPRDGSGHAGDPAAKDTPSLDIVYRPAWPAKAPVLRFGETLTEAKNGLAAVRGQSSVALLYQQSLARDPQRARDAVVLMDPTRQKTSDVAAAGLEGLPAGIRTAASAGRTYFPNLPPHLAMRVYVDPARGTKGTLVVEGQRVADGVGEAYLLLNTLRGADREAVLGLCPADDPDRGKWESLVGDLATVMETFREDAAVRGLYRPQTNLAEVVDVESVPEVKDSDVAVDSYALSASGPGQGYVTLVMGNGRAFTPSSEPVSLAILRVAGELYPGEVKPIPSVNPLNELFTLQHTADQGGRTDEYEYEWRIARPVDGAPPAADAAMTAYRAVAVGLDRPRHTLGGAGVDVLADNYVVMRYRPSNPAHPLFETWSPWTQPQLVEGWVKRVLAGINPFNQRIADLFNNQVNTESSIVSQAGERWEGDIALSLDNMNEHGLIPIYETVLRRGRMLSVDAGINEPAANDALLLAAGYLNDLYILLGNEAYADAADPTIGIGTRHGTYGDVATALFSFKGQVASLLDEELALLRGRDDAVQPGARVRPVYNRLFWNYTRGIQSGEVVYALNYDIRENPANGADGVINAADARRMYPQGHGDAYGHYLTALKGYHQLLFDADFEWVPRTEAVSVLGQPVQVDYMDERKFAAAAAALARTGLQISDLVWRQDIGPGTASGWARFAPSRTNTNVLPSVPRHWGLDHWSARAAQGAYFNWVLGNAMLPAVDPDPSHEGIRKIDRTTVPELAEIVATSDAIQSTMDSADGGLTPLGLPADGIAFDIDPNLVVGGNGSSHFEQVERRAVAALANAVAAFDDAKDVSRLMRGEADSLAELQERIADQERAWDNRLVEIYGTPYTDDIGPGRTYRQGYAGPDLLHYQYLDMPSARPSDSGALMGSREVRIDLQQASADWRSRLEGVLDDVVPAGSASYQQGVHYLTLNVDAEGIPSRPMAWTGTRRSPGRIQQALSSLVQSRARLMDALDAAEGGKEALDQAIALFRNEVGVQSRIRDLERDLLVAEQTLSAVQFAADVWEKGAESSKDTAARQLEVMQESLPKVFIAGLAAGGDLTAPARAVMQEAKAITTGIFEWAEFLRFFAVRGLEFGTDTAARWVTADQIAPLERGLERTAAMAELVDAINGLGDHFGIIDQRLRELDDARRAYRALVAEGERLQDERFALRRRAAASVQGFRTRDAALRIFRNEKLERYKSLFDLAARYTYLAANAFDYETGLLGNERGRGFLQRILRSRALGVVRDGRPQFVGSSIGDPGLSGILAELGGDWSVLRGRLGINNPDVYATTASLRTGLHRILPGPDGDPAWIDLLSASRRENLLADEDVRRHCLQLGGHTGLSVPGLLLEFSTTIAEGRNVFGRPLAAGDVSFSPSSFATKIFAAGVALEGYRGMDQPGANTGVVGGSSPADPTGAFLDGLALSSTPYVYLIPAGIDSMRSPPIADASDIRSWNVLDVTVPLPFDIGGVDAALRRVAVASDTLPESLYAVRGHQAFRAVGSSSTFSFNLFGAGGQIIPSHFTNRRLIGRSAWNSRWKLVIPGSTLLNDPAEGIDRFIRTVRDVRVHFVTYSYSGN